MAISKLKHIKERKTGNMSTGLINAIEYIMNPEKTEDGALIYSNCGFESKDIYQSFMNTKRKYNKLDGRQGYHFVISFSPDENVSEGICMNVMKEFAEMYLKNEYDYVLSVHNDTDHMHGHLVFNSVNSKTSLKYRYVDGDWQKDIQPIVDEIAEKYGLEKLNFEREYDTPNKDIDWLETIKNDIDACVEEAATYDDFCNLMRSKYKYQIREGSSDKHGLYLSFKPLGKKKAVRSYNLPIDYQPEFIKQRIEGVITNTKSPKFTKAFVRRRVYIVRHKKRFIKYKDMSNYQRYMFKKSMKNKALYGSRTTRPRWEAERLNREMNRSTDEIIYLTKNNLRNRDDINDKYNDIFKQRKTVISKINKLKRQYKDYVYGKPSVFSDFERYTDIIARGGRTELENDFVQRFELEYDVEYINSLYQQFNDELSPLKEKRYELSMELKKLKNINKSSCYIISDKKEKEIKAEHPDDYVISVNIQGEKGNLLISEDEDYYITRVPATKDLLKIPKKGSMVINDGNTLIAFLPKEGASVLNEGNANERIIDNRDLYDNHYVFDKKYNNINKHPKTPHHNKKR